MKTVGVIVGRFQTPRLHIGHRSLIENVLARHDDVVIVLGQSGAQLTQSNPLDVATRAKMIMAEFPMVSVTSIHDQPSDRLWSLSLDSLLNDLYPTHTPILYGNRDSFVLSYTGQHEYRKLAETVEASATDIRRAIVEPMADDAFRCGVIYAARNRYPICYQTVDVACINKDRVLLGRKHIDDGKYRFPGGFVDPKDVSLERAAGREFSEETGNIGVEGMKYLGSVRIDDSRYRNTEDSIISAFFVTQYVFGAPSSGDDLDEVEWVSISAMMDNLVSHHKPMGEMLLAHLRKETA